MKAIKHATGPWKANGASVLAGLGVSRSEAAANACLIAAAPDLLEALQHIVRCIPIGGFAQIHHGSSTWQQIDDAITKATGSAP